MTVDRRTVLVSGLAASGLIAGTAWAAGDVSTGITTLAMLDNKPPAYRVTGIGWFSGFRDSGLRIGDLIVAVDGMPVKKPATPEEQRNNYKAIGSYGEPQHWSEAKKGEGAKVVLKVLRRATPGQGWQTLDIAGQVKGQVFTRDAGNRNLLGPGGPPEMYEYDGFDRSWRDWADNFAKSLGAVLDDPLFALSLSTEYEAKQLEQQRPRVELLQRKYPGPFARAVAADFNAAVARLKGPPFTLPPDALDFRELGEKRADEIRGKAKEAWAAIQAELTDRLIVQPFPAVHPIHGDRASVQGKYVVLPPLRNRDWVGEAGHTWFVAGNRSDGWYFADAEGTEAGLMLDARNRYRRLVVPHIDESYQIIGEVLAQPGQLVIGERAYFGLALRPVAALIGEALFVDMRKPDKGIALFAGEEVLRRPSADLPPDSAGPIDVVKAMVAALKAGDQALYTETFATWGIDLLDDGRVLFRANAQRVPDSYFERARQSIMTRVWDARPVWIDEVRAVIPGTDYPGQPRLEEVIVELEHVGQFDGTVRTFNDVTVSRWWRLQRLGDGPWRISTIQEI